MKLLNGDCLEQLKLLPDNSVDSLVTDPPAAIGFMGRDWDSDRGGRTQWVSWMTDVMRECLRVMKPGAHGLVWAIPRTSHWMAWACEDAGFEVRDVVTHLFGQGFPKSLNVNKELAKSGLSCQCRTNVLQYHNEDVPNLSEEMDAEESLSGRAKQDMLASVRGQSGQNKAEKKEAAPDLSVMCSAVHAEKQSSSEQSEVLFREVLRVVAVNESKDQTPNETDFKAGDKGGGQSRITSEEGASWSEQSSVEGWSNLQAEQGELHRPEVRSMPEGIHADGAERRLHYGTSASYGEASREVPSANGSGAPQGPQHAKQSNRQSGAIPKQRGTQTCGSCGKAIIQEGLGTALKPASEHWILVRKPCSEKTVAANVLKWGTGALNIDGCRVDLKPGETTHGSGVSQSNAPTTAFGDMGTKRIGAPNIKSTQGRFPANLVLSHSDHCTDSQCDIECAIRTLDEQSIAGGMHSAGKARANMRDTSCDGKGLFHMHGAGGHRLGDSGGASRFFYCAKSSKREKNAGLEGNLSWENADQNLVGQMAELDLLLKGMSDDTTLLLKDTSWSTDLYGHSIAEQYPQVLMSTIETTIKLITELKTLSCSQSLSTSANIRDAIETIEANGLSLAESVEFTSRLNLDSIREKTASLLSVVNAVLRVLLSVRLAARQGNIHSTVKAQKLMTYLCRMVTPPGGVILDPFAGSGSTGVAALSEGWDFIGIEKDPDYFKILERRVFHAFPEVEKKYEPRESNSEGTEGTRSGA